MDVFKLQQEMLTLEADDPDVKSGLEDASNKVQQEFMTALDKAKEYDTTNADIEPLRAEIKKIAEDAHKPPDYTRPAIEHMPPEHRENVAAQAGDQIHVSTGQQGNQPQKSGCSMMLAMMMVFAAACVGIAVWM